MTQATIGLGPVVTNEMLDMNPGSVDTVNEAFDKVNANFTELYPLITPEVVITTNVITAAESGKTFYLSLAGGFTSTLPAPALGLKYRFVVAIAPTTAYVVATNAGANLLYGTWLDVVGELTAFTAQDKFNFLANASVIGDSLDVESDGTNWYCRGFSAVNTGVSTAAT